MPSNRKVTHRFLGACLVTDACIILQRQNPDETSMFVEHEGDTKEVSKALVTESAFYGASVDTFCKWCNKSMLAHPRYLKMGLENNYVLRQHCDGTVYKLTE
jgi:hypothetical protein